MHPRRRQQRNDVVNKEANYKINVNRVRSYFMTPTQGPLKLAYENPKGHSAPQFDFIVASPVGNKAYCWIYNDMMTNNICVRHMYLEAGAKETTAASTNIPLELVYGGIEGTIFYGTVASPTTFIIEDIFYFQGKYVSHATWKEKLALYAHIFATYPSIYPAFVLPFMCTSLDELRQNCRHLAYKIGTIQYKRWDSKKACVVEPFTNTHMSQRRTAVPQPQPLTTLWTKADPNADIYYLYKTAAAAAAMPPANGKTVGMALIPNYKTSVKMNQLFRNIKENARLDALEESDDEEEFENTADDKFITQKEAIQLQYLWHPKFRKYYPSF